jgi:hypothetical protein
VKEVIMKQLQGFVAGTLIHTDKGLVPIEQIKVGDMVLSKPEIGEGELAYKPVVNTFEFEDKEVWFVKTNNSSCYDEENIYSGEIKYHNEFIIGTPDHPFWRIGKLDRSRGSSNAQIKLYPKAYWSRLNELTIDTIVLLANGTMSVVESIQPVSVMANPEYGFIQGYKQYQWWTEDSGSYIDFSEHTPILHNQKYNALFNEEVRFYPNDGEWDFPTKKRKVYNFEVADYHTYFVGEGGIWVHHANGYLTQ